MPRLFKEESSHAKVNAQRNLCGRTHYVDDDTLRWHESRVISARVVDNGLLFAIVTSDSIDPPSNWTGKKPRRGFRYVIFDVFGTVLGRTKLENTYRTSDKATKAMWNEVNAIDAYSHTLKAIEEARKNYNKELDDLALTTNSLRAKFEKTEAQAQLS